MNNGLAALQPYPFQRLASLLADTHPPTDLPEIRMHIGEPRHEPPAFILDALQAHLHELNCYPATKGLVELRASIARWLETRYQLIHVDEETQVLPVNGTREALFATIQALIASGNDELVLMPNPFYQVYEGATLLAGARPVYLNNLPHGNDMPDFHAVDDALWRACRVLFVCSPGNPTGTLLSLDDYRYLLELAHRHDFIIASDECYSELYLDESNPPPGLLQAAHLQGDDSYHRCLVFNSLSKRSSVPGLRSGLLAGDAELMSQILLYRTYHGCAMPIHHQYASMEAWQDENHVKLNRQRYREKYTQTSAILGDCFSLNQSAIGFYLWLSTPYADTDFTRDLFNQQHLSVLPGTFLARESQGINPGLKHVRLALVPPLDICLTAAERLRTFMQQL